MDKAQNWKKSRLILLDRLDFPMIHMLSIAFHNISKHMLTSILLDALVLPRYTNGFPKVRGLQLIKEMKPFCLKKRFTLLSFWVRCVHVEVNASDSLLYTFLFILVYF